MEVLLDYIRFRQSPRFMKTIGNPFDDVIRFIHFTKYTNDFLVNTILLALPNAGKMIISTSTLLKLESPPTSPFATRRQQHRVQ